MKAMLLEPLLAMDIIFLLSWFSMVATVDFNNKTITFELIP